MWTTAECVTALLCVLLAWAVLHRGMRALFTPPLYTHQTLSLALPEEADQMQSGDLLLFDGHHLDAALVRGWCDAPFSHAGLVWRDQVSKELHVYNSDVDERHTCVLCGRGGSDRTTGVQLNTMVRKVSTYKGRVYHVPLTRRLSTSQLNVWEHELFPQLCNRVFRHSLAEMAHLAFPTLVPLFSVDTSRKLFCTELVALVYRRLGVGSPVLQGQLAPSSLARSLHSQGAVDMARMKRIV